MSDYDSRPPRIGLWKNERGPFASGNCGSIRFVVWENTRKDNDRAPDFHLVLEAAQRRDDLPEKPGSDVDNEPEDKPEPQGGGDLGGDEIPF